MFRPALAAAALLGASAALAAEPDPRFDQTSIPLEELPADPAAIKIVLVAGKVSKAKPGEHEYFAGSALLYKMLKQTPGVFPVLVRDGWPKNAEVFKDARAVVFYMDGGGSQPFLTPDRMELLAGLMKSGCGLVHLHQVIDYPRVGGAQITPWLGGAWDKEIGCRGHWVGECKDFPDHPIMRGVTPFSIDDGWIFNIRFVGDMKGVTPLIKVVPPEKLRTTSDAKKHTGRAEVMAWAFERDDGGRAFTFVGGHLHSNWGMESVRRFAVNGILWTAKADVPAGGAKVDLDPAELDKHFDRKPAPAKK
jgi:hypothetical protein